LTQGQPVHQELHAAVCVDYFSTRRRYTTWWCNADTSRGAYGGCAYF